MIQPGERLLVAVSGGKDSLAVWDLLLELGYEADGLYLGLGIGEYSDESGVYARDFAERAAGRWSRSTCREQYGYDIPTGSRAAKREPCSACGLSKRHLFDQAALDGGYDVFVTGHNLDDEAAVLFGNVLHWQTDYLGRQLPVLPAGDGFPRKVKPLVRLTERETAAYCVVQGIDYIVEECPHGGRQQAPRLQGGAERGRASVTGHEARLLLRVLVAGVRALPGRGRGRTGRARVAANVCGAPTPGEVCAFCRLVERAGGRASTAPVILRPRRGPEGTAA